MTPERSTEELEYKSAHAQPEEKRPYTPRPKSQIVLAWVLLAVVLLLLLGRKTVRFETFGGTAIGSRKARRGERLTRPPVPEKEGCGFGGWYQDTACTKPWDFDNDTVKKSMTLYAKWL